MNTKKGFTLIELLIVIAIIGILAVAFVPTLLDAPARGRDSQRIANLSTIRTVLLDLELRDPASMPDGSGCIGGAGADINLSALASQFGGVIPTDPSELGPTTDDMGACADGYLYSNEVDGYNFALVSRVENYESANSSCGDLSQILEPNEGDEDQYCYAIFVQ